MSEPTLRDVLAAALDQARPDLAPRLQDDPAAYLELVTLARDAHSETGELLRAAVVSARRAGCTWEQVGGVLGMTKQAAQQRYAVPDEPAASPQGSARRATLAPLTAFNEMRVLERAGRYGWHGVAFGPMYFLVEQSDEQWEHHRAYVGTGPLRDGGDWQRIGRWGWWVYYKRPLGIPPLPGLTDVHDLVLP
ncbi:MAG: hypothetical protein BGO37_17130 [Cellulomonas sp. 73-92]|uniref:hypothetical protein n=1 Tax=Cellulomonas sp. 73-92 TaxID=1895740 RepID=UPI00092A5877|nr:hypothetical protein [Cellulomonas sp. 73-92]OJV81185.1 MAG: hypothetical protein BGO37_17130 [Cellulomonas sp. 73-92]